MTVETVNQGQILVVGEENQWIFLTRDEAVELLEKLPKQISEMPVNKSE